MPRPRAFDTETALDAALVTFWRLGYEATTLTALTDAMAISRPSLYNAFGDKEALFLAALARYGATYAAMFDALDAEPDARTAVAAHLQAVAAGLADPSHPAGCLRVAHTARASAAEPALASALARSQHEQEAAFARRLARARRDGQIPAGEDPALLAAFFVGVVNAMAVRARVDADAAVLAGIAERGMRAWPA